jgi:hypothetical protein
MGPAGTQLVPKNGTQIKPHGVNQVQNRTQIGPQSGPMWPHRWTQAFGRTTPQSISPLHNPYTTLYTTLHNQGCVTEVSEKLLTQPLHKAPGTKDLSTQGPYTRPYTSLTQDPPGFFLRYNIVNGGVRALKEPTALGARAWTPGLQGSSPKHGIGPKSRAPNSAKWGR